MSSLKDLIKSGFIQANEELIWKRRIENTTHSAVVNIDGSIRYLLMFNIISVVLKISMVFIFYYY